MINGSVIAPFRHDSTWPDDVLARFRPAVYYLHVPVPGRDPVSHLRELIRLILRKQERPETSDQWTYLKDACNNVVHLSVDGNVKDEEMANLAKNLLIFANLLLIEDYGLETLSSVRYETEDSAKNEEHEARSKAAREQFLANINHAYESLENAIKALRQPGGGRREPLNLEKAAVLSLISSSHPLVNDEDDPTGRIVLVIHDTDACEYAFHPHDPIGWEMTGGNRANDRFADDGMSSMGFGVAR